MDSQNNKIVNKNVIMGFQGKTLVKYQIASLIGFFIGLKIADYFFYDENKYLVIREQIEDEYWAKHGEPQEIIPYRVQYYDKEKEGQYRNSWIQIIFEKDQRPYKEKYLDK